MSSDKEEETCLGEQTEHPKATPPKRKWAEKSSSEESEESAEEGEGEAASAMEEPKKKKARKPRGPGRYHSVLEQTIKLIETLKGTETVDARADFWRKIASLQFHPDTMSLPIEPKTHRSHRNLTKLWKQLEKLEKNWSNGSQIRDLKVFLEYLKEE